MRVDEIVPSMNLSAYLAYMRTEARTSRVNLTRSGAPEPTDIVETILSMSLGSGSKADHGDEIVASRYQIDESGVHLLPGASCAVFIALAAAHRLAPTSAIACEYPGYPLFEHSSAIQNVRTMRFERDVTSGEINLESLERTLDAGCKIVCLTNPHNPSGHSLPSSMSDDLVTLVNRFDGTLVIDDVFQGFAEADTRVHFGRAPIVVCGSDSKVLGLGSLRMGWACSNNADLNASLVTAADYVLGQPISRISSLIAATELHRNGLLQDHRRKGRDGQSQLRRWRSAAGAAVRSQLPAYSLIQLPATCQLSSIEFCRLVLDNYCVALAPGSCFGVEGTIRIGTVASSEDLLAGLEAIDGVLQLAST